MQLSHAPARVSARFDEANLVAAAGLVPVMVLAARVGLSGLVSGRCTVPSAKPGAKVTALVAGMVAGADCIDDMDLLRHGGMGRLFDGVRAPSTLGTFLRCFTFGHVRQLDAVAAGVLAGLVAHTPVLAVDSGLVLVDVDDTMREVHGYAKQGAGYGYSGVKGLNALLATVSTPTSAPLIAAARLRKGSTNSARGAGRIVAEALATVKAAGIDLKRQVALVRADSAFFTHEFVGAARRAGARFSVTARMNPAVVTAIASIPETAWVAIHYPNAFADTDTGELVSDAEVAEIEFTAFTSRRKAEHVTGRLIVRRVRRLNPRSALGQQDELFAAHRHHAVFTDSPMTMLQAESQHRGHAIVEQVIAELKAGPLAHLPSGKFNANAAWLICTAIAFNLTRAAGALASVFHAKATGATIRAQLITVPARIARSARRIMLHLPEHWPWAAAWNGLFTACLGPPRAATS
jgi:Transposase DDE domain group 1